MGSMRVTIFEARILGGSALSGVISKCVEHGLGGGLHRGDVAGMDFEIAELPLDDENAALHLGRFQRHVGQGLDIEAGRHFDDLRRHVGCAAASPGSRCRDSTWSAAAAGR